jgi:hypothetical protein
MTSTSVGTQKDESVTIVSGDLKVWFVLTNREEACDLSLVIAIEFLKLASVPAFEGAIDLSPGF